uniref:Uncharacterized protein n=1 Tax=Hyaloperonospora arabidopsidis (strain Emoy2) TaxID=559515 RepID=M4C4V1_HYAAE
MASRQPSVNGVSANLDDHICPTAVRSELTRVTPIDFESIALTTRPSCLQMSIAEICHHLCPAATPDERQISHDGHDTNLIRATYCCPTHAFTIARTARKPPHKMAMSYHPLGVSRMPDQSQLAHKTMILVNLGHRVSRLQQ